MLVVINQPSFLPFLIALQKKSHIANYETKVKLFNTYYMLKSQLKSREAKYQIEN